MNPQTCHKCREPLEDWEVNGICEICGEKQKPMKTHLDQLEYCKSEFARLQKETKQMGYRLRIIEGELEVCCIGAVYDMGSLCCKEPSHEGDCYRYEKQYHFIPENKHEFKRSKEK